MQPTTEGESCVATSSTNNSLSDHEKVISRTVSNITLSSVEQKPSVGQVSLTYKELHKVEKTRRRLLTQVEDHVFKTIFRWDGTCLSLILSDPLLWLTILLYIMIRVSENNQKSEIIRGLALGSYGNVSVIGGFLSFFLVYFVVESSKRFDEQYLLCMEGKGCVLDFASLANSYLDRDQGLRLVRYMNAAYAAGFVGLSDAYTYNDFFIQYNRHAIVLTDHELDRIEVCNMDEGGSCYREILQWVQVEIKDALEKKVIDTQTAKQLRTKVLGLQSCMSKLFNFADQPLIFFYIHFISLVSVLYLPLFTLNNCYVLTLNKEHVDESALLTTGVGETVHWSSDVVAGCIVLLQTIFVNGLRILGQKLSDPFGTDYEDLSVMHYITFTWKQSARIMAAHPPSQDEQTMTETEIILKRAPIGAAWDVRSKSLHSRFRDEFKVNPEEEIGDNSSPSNCILQ